MCNQKKIYLRISITTLSFKSILFYIYLRYDISSTSIIVASNNRIHWIQDTDKLTEQDIIRKLLFEDWKYISYGFYLLGYYSLETDQIYFYSLTKVF